METDIVAMTLAELSNAIRQRKVSSVEATQACLRAAERWQPVVNCCINLDPDGAVDAACIVDGEIAAGRWRGPLHGVPIAFKDMFIRAGKPVTFGAHASHRLVANETATVMQRLEAAGAVLLGGLNMGEFAVSPTGHNDHFGDCRNPWNPERITGGSSSGSGAAVAARIVPAALGSDTGGSIRLPAAICGVTGMKPTYGVVSRHGCLPRSWSLDTVGPLARTALDCALVLEAIAGSDAADAATLGPQLRRIVPRTEGPARMYRIGVPVADEPWIVEPEMRAALDGAASTFADLGMPVREVRLPDVRRYYDAANLINKVEGVSIHRDRLVSHPEHYSPSVRSRLEPGLYVPAPHYLDAQRARAPLLREFVASAFAEVDMLLLPVLACATPTIEETRFRESGTQPRLVSLMTGQTRWLNYLGLPALTCPCGFRSDGMPVGFQLVGRPFRDADLFEAGAAFQRVTDFHAARPSIV